MVIGGSDDDGQEPHVERTTALITGEFPFKSFLQTMIWLMIWHSDP